jgi:hypothetical protein
MFTKNDERINRKGRPRKTKSLTDLLNAYLAHKDADKVTRKARLAEKLFDLAMDGDIAAIKYIYDRIDGKPIETIKNEPSASLAIPVIFTPPKKEYSDRHEPAVSGAMEPPAQTSPSA